MHLRCTYIHCVPNKFTYIFYESFGEKSTNVDNFGEQNTEEVRRKTPQVFTKLPITP